MTLLKIIETFLKIVVLKWDLAILYHKLSHIVKRLELIIIESKSDYNLFAKSFVKEYACLLCYASCVAESIAKLIYKYNDIIMNNLLSYMW